MSARRGCFALAALSFFPPACAVADELGTPVASVHLEEAKTKLLGLPAEAPRPAWYSFKRGSGMGCGLLSKGATTISPLVEPGEDGAWPTCLGITHATAFEWHGQPVYVYRYLQRDTREDTYTYDAFVRVVNGGIEDVDGLNASDSPSKKTILQAAAWGKSALAAAEGEKAGYTTSAKDTVLTDTAFLGVGRNAATASCRVVADLVTADGRLAPVTVPCKAIVATSALVGHKATWLVVLTQGADGSPRGQVFVADPAGVREAADLEQKLAPQIAGGKVLAVKASLKALVGG